jgi:hypothetical protein
VELEIAKDLNGSERYYVLNFQNKNTIEIRIFRGTLRLLTLYATLEFVYWICKWLKELDTAKIQKITWGDFVKSIPEWMIELKEYLKEKNLIKN